VQGFSIMVRTGLFAGCFAFLALAGTALAADRVPGSGGIIFKPLVQPQATIQAPMAPSPYPMNYSEQVAQSLGVRDGGLDLVRPADHSGSYTPSVSFNGSMLRLQWRP
jgi:hypothetical protein